MNVRPSFAALGIGFSLTGCAQTVFVLDFRQRPIKSVKVTLTNDRGGSNSVRTEHSSSGNFLSSSTTVVAIVVKRIGDGRKLAETRRGGARL